MAKKDLEQAEKDIKEFEENVNRLTLDRMNEAPKEDVDAQTKMSSREINKSKDIYLKPKKSVYSSEKFNEKFRSDYEYQKEYVQFIAENKEIIGEDIDLWTKPFPGIPAEEWVVPTNKPIWGPRYLAEQISRAKYHRLVMQQTTTHGDGMGSYYGQMVADTIIQRLDAIPVNSYKKGKFLEAKSF